MLRATSLNAPSAACAVVGLLFAWELVVDVVDLVLRRLAAPAVERDAVFLGEGFRAGDFFFAVPSAFAPDLAPALFFEGISIGPPLRAVV